MTQNGNERQKQRLISKGLLFLVLHVLLVVSTREVSEKILSQLGMNWHPFIHWNLWCSLGLGYLTIQWWQEIILFVLNQDLKIRSKRAITMSLALYPIALAVTSYLLMFVFFRLPLWNLLVELIILAGVQAILSIRILGLARGVQSYSADETSN